MSAGSLEELAQDGFPAWVDEQLKAPALLDAAADAYLRGARLHIKYPAGDGWAAVDEMRPLTSLDAPISTLWHLVDHKNPMHAAERRRPRDEVIAATVLRAVHSRWQLREVMCGFWHDHFNVDAVGSEAIGVALPSYDRDVIRKHCFGNFREFLEAVAQSAAMQYYLSNRSSRAGSAQLIKMDLGLQAATVDLGGWDTHEYQPGRFRNQVERLSRGLSAFYNDMVRYQDRLVVVVVTEFGRRLRSNRSNGTDHGRGSVMMVLGGKVTGGKIYGRWPGLKAEQLEEGVDLAVANDYRQSLTEVIAHWRGGINPADVFPGFKPASNLGLFAS